MKFARFVEFYVNFFKTQHVFIRALSDTDLYTTDEPPSMFTIPWSEDLDYFQVLNMMIEDVDIIFVDPRIYPHLMRPILTSMEIYKGEQNFTALKKLQDFRKWIEDYPEKRRAEILCSREPPPPVVKPPALTEEQVQAEVSHVMDTGEIKYFQPDELELVLEGLRKRRIECIKAGDYLQAERAEHYTKVVLSFGQLGTVEAMQGTRVAELKKKLHCAKADLEQKKKAWEDKLAKLQKTANQELKLMEQTHKQEIEDFVALKNEDPPPQFRKQSPGLLSLKRSMTAAVRQKNYSEAGKLKQIVETQEAIEEKQNKERWMSEIDLRIANLRKRQKSDVKGRIVYWKGQKLLLVKQANQDIDNATRAVEHLTKHMGVARDAKVMAGELKNGQKKKSDVSGSGCPLPFLNTHAIEKEKALAHRQRAILNQSIYTRRPETAVKRSVVRR